MINNVTIENQSIHTFAAKAKTTKDIWPEEPKTYSLELTNQPYSNHLEFSTKAWWEKKNIIINIINKSINKKSLTPLSELKQPSQVRPIKKNDNGSKN